MRMQNYFSEETTLKAKRLFVAGGMSVLALAASIGAASADSPQQCPVQEACLYYNSNLEGAHGNDRGQDLPSYGQMKFSIGGGAGFNQLVKNNTASISTGNDVGGYRVYYNSNYAGVYQTIGGNSWANLNSQLKNQNASGRHL